MLAAQEIVTGFDHTKFGALIITLIAVMRFLEHAGKLLWGRIFDKSGDRSRPVVRMDPEMIHLLHDISKHQEECTMNQLNVAHAMERLSDRLDHQADKINDKIDDLRVQVAAAGKNGC